MMKEYWHARYSTFFHLIIIAFTIAEIFFAKIWYFTPFGSKNPSLIIRAATLTAYLFFE